jgi:hypothetical protein
VKRKPAASTGAFVANDEPLAFRHIEQWQYTIGPIAPLTS